MAEQKARNGNLEGAATPVELSDDTLENVTGGTDEFDQDFLESQHITLRKFSYLLDSGRDIHQRIISEVTQTSSNRRDPERPVATTVRSELIWSMPAQSNNLNR